MASDVREQLQAILGSGYVIEWELEGGGMSRVFLAMLHGALAKRYEIVRHLGRGGWRWCISRGTSSTSGWSRSRSSVRS